MSEGSKGLIHLGTVRCPNCLKYFFVHDGYGNKTKCIHCGYEIGFEIEGEIYRKIEQKKRNIGDNERDFEIVPFEDIKPILDEAKKEIFRDMNGGNELALFITLKKLFGEEGQLCGSLSPPHNFPCTQPKGHKGNHTNYRYELVNQNKTE